MSLNPKCESAGYLLGRLSAVLQTLETAATGATPPRSQSGLNFTLALESPGLVLDLWSGAAQDWLQTLAVCDPQRHIALSARLVALIGRISSDRVSAANRSDEQKCLFVAGYHHQREAELINGEVDGPVTADSLRRFGMPWFLLILVSQAHQPKTMSPLMAFVDRAVRMADRGGWPGWCQ